MSSGTMMQYTDDEIIHIMHEGFSYTLEKSVIDNIQKIANEVGAPEYIRTPQFLKQNTNSISDKRKDLKNINQMKYQMKIGKHLEIFKQQKFKRKKVLINL